MNSGKNKQPSALFKGILWGCGVWVFGGTVGAQAVPAGVGNSMMGPTRDKFQRPSAPAEMLRRVDTTTHVNGIKPTAPEGLLFTPESTPAEVSFHATQQFHAAAPAFLLMKYVVRFH